jgi:hypothetical protein
MSKFKDKKTGLLLVTLILAAGSAFLGARMLRSPSHPNALAQARYPYSPTIAHPLPAFATQTTLSAAPTELGTSLTLPNTSQLQLGDVGAVWTASVPGGTTTVAVTYPSQGMIVKYTRPVPYAADPATAYQRIAQEMGSGDQVIDLDGKPALAIKQNSDQTGANFGVIMFLLNDGTEVRVLGHNDQPTLQAVAQSILDRAASSSS